MKYSIIFTKFLCFISLFFISLHASSTEYKYTFGIHDFILDNTHTQGFNYGISLNYNTDSHWKHLIDFELLTDDDPKRHDPDHIPVWFQGNYSASRPIYNLSKYLYIDGLVHLNWKMNTVSSIEQNFKLGTGLGLHYSLPHLDIASKLLLGTYYHEIDDDVPRTRGYSRKELTKGFVFSYAYTIQAQYKITHTLSTYGDIIQYFSTNQWLETESTLGLKYHYETNSANIDIVLDAQNSHYNIKRLRAHKDPILPWNTENIIRLFAVVPF